MCMFFSFDMNKWKISEPAKQLVGVDGVFIGSPAEPKPPIIVLQEDRQTITVTEL